MFFEDDFEKIMNKLEKDKTNHNCMHSTRHIKKINPTCKSKINCKSTGQLIINGGMEDITNNKPNNWHFINPDGITSIKSKGRVHSGYRSVNIKNNSAIEQTIPITGTGCYYQLSFFARGKESHVSLIANVTYQTTTGFVNGGSIIVRKEDLNKDFGFYQLVTIASPENVTGITVKISVSAEGNQSLDLDDVSLIIL